MQAITSRVKKLLLNFPQPRSVHWWIEIVTADPNCIYYFGPFLDFEEAFEMGPGYVEDLINEGTQQIHMVIKRCDPAELTQYDEAETTTTSTEN